MSVIIGQGDFVEKEPSENWDSNAGWSTVRSWVGPVSKYVTFVQSQIPGGYIQLRKSQIASTVTIEASYPMAMAGESGTQPDPISTTWTLSYQKQEVTLYHSKTLRQQLKAMTVDMGQFKEAVETCRAHYISPVVSAEFAAHGYVGFPYYFANEDDEWPITALPTTKWDSLTPDQKQTLIEYYARFLDDAGTLEVSLPVLQKNQLLSSTTQIRASHKNAGSVHTQAQLFVAEPLLPSAILIDVNSADFASYLWLKEQPNITATSNGRWELNQEYLGLMPGTAAEFGDYGWGIYDTLIYPAAT